MSKREREREKNNAKPVPPALSPGRNAACTLLGGARMCFFSRDAKVIVALYSVHPVRWGCGELGQCVSCAWWSLNRLKYRMARGCFIPARCCLNQDVSSSPAFHIPRIEVSELYRRGRNAHRPGNEMNTESKLLSAISSNWFRRGWGGDASLLMSLVGIELRLLSTTFFLIPWAVEENDSFLYSSEIFKPTLIGNSRKSQGVSSELYFLF